MQVTNLFASGGLPLYGVLLFSMLAHGAGVGGLLAAFLSRSRSLAVILGSLALGLSVLTVLVGGFGFWWGFTIAEEAAQFADPAFKAQILELGYREAMTTLVAGGGGALLPSLFGVVTLLRAWRRASPAAEQPA